jgi:hypothetical protein
MSEPLTWSCHFCSAIRDDADIAVISTVRMMGPVEVKMNRRYCRDKEECHQAAERWAEHADDYGNLE